MAFTQRHLLGLEGVSAADITAILDSASRNADRSQPRSLGDEALDLHRRYRGALAVAAKIPLKDELTLGVIATPGVASAKTLPRGAKE